MGIYNPELKGKKLKPCPFCGENRLFGECVNYEGINFYNKEFTQGPVAYIRCETCGAHSGDDITDSLALKKWNKRKGKIQSLQKQNKKLVDEKLLLLGYYENLSDHFDGLLEKFELLKEVNDE